MKKLVVLMLVLGVASLANATLQISVNGNPEPVDSEIIIAPSGSAILDIWTNAAMPTYSGTSWALVAMLEDASITGGQKMVADPGVGDPYAGASSYIPGKEGMWSAISITGATIVSGTKLYDEFILHCHSGQDAIVQLYETADFMSWTLSDTVIIHQIPEPITMVLLGLGGLFLRRR